MRLDFFIMKSTRADKAKRKTPELLGGCSGANKKPANRQNPAYTTEFYHDSPQQGRESWFVRNADQRT